MSSASAHILPGRLSGDPLRSSGCMCSQVSGGRTRPVCAYRRTEPPGKGQQKFLACNVLPGKGVSPLEGNASPPPPRALPRAATHQPPSRRCLSLDLPAPLRRLSTCGVLDTNPASFMVTLHLYKKKKIGRRTSQWRPFSRAVVTPLDAGRSTPLAMSKQGLLLLLRKAETRSLGMAKQLLSV